MAHLLSSSKQKWIGCDNASHSYLPELPRTKLLCQRTENLTAEPANDLIYNDNERLGQTGCLMTSGCCWSSAADEEWYSPKRPSSTVAINSSELNTWVSALFLQLIYNASFYTLPEFPPFIHYCGGGCKVVKPERVTQVESQRVEVVASAAARVHDFFYNVFCLCN